MFFQLKITLKDVKPSIWRRIVVSDEINLFQLHNVLQVAFNWSNAHLYQFMISGFEIDIEGGMENSEAENQLNVNEVKLKDFPLEEKETFKYWYDFGDDWMHQIVIEKIMELGPEFPICLAGKHNAPPEDCGGPWAYNDLRKRMAANKLNSDEKDWIEGYDPEYFDMEEVNDLLSDEDTINEEGFFF